MAVATRYTIYVRFKGIIHKGTTLLGCFTFHFFQLVYAVCLYFAFAPPMRIGTLRIFGIVLLYQLQNALPIRDLIAYDAITRSLTLPCYGISYI